LPQCPPPAGASCDPFWLSRRDVLSYLAQKNIPWREDSTNADTRYLRNRVRHRLIPLLSDDFPNWRKALSSLAETQSLAADFIVSEANLRVKWRPLPETPGISGAFDAPGEGLSTGEENFFAQPAIVREEALFQGIDALMAGSGYPQALAHEVRRSNVRRFSRGEMPAADLGRVRVRRKGGSIVLSRQKKGSGKPAGWGFCSEYGFSLLINAHGFYNLKGIALEVGEGMTAAGAGDAVFFARLPLVLRPSFKEDRIGRAGSGAGAFCAVDSLGIAAFIGTDGLLERRRGAPYEYDASQAASENLCAVKVGTGRSIGGINVQQSKRRSV